MITNAPTRHARSLQRRLPVAACLSVAIGAIAMDAAATVPCGDFGECKALIEINASDGDIGFHFLMDGNDLNSAKIFDPNWRWVFVDRALGPLREQKLTETFAESAEPLCWEDPEADEDETIVTLEEFLDRWTAGTYRFFGRGDRWTTSFGQTVLSYELPAAPADVDFDGSAVSWDDGDDLGECASSGELEDLVSDNVLPTHPEDVAVAAWEIVLEPDVDDPSLSMLKFSIRVPGDISPKEVTVPADYLASLPDDTPVKIEVGAIGVDDNATFSEEDGFCVNEVDGCED